MAVFNPDVPDAPEPNYLRYSRPSNYAEPNKAVGEAFKAGGEVISQGLRTADSLVKQGLSQSVEDKFRPIAEREIQGLEARRDELYGSNLSGQNKPTQTLGYSDETNQTPKDVKNLPGRLQNLQDAKANGTYSATYTDSVAYKEIRELRDKFPAFRGYIDAQTSKVMGEREANKYRASLISDINSAESQLREGKNKLESEAYQAINRHELHPINFEAWKQGKLSDADLRERIYAGNGRRNSLEMDKLEFEKYEHDRTRQANLAEDSIRSDAAKGLKNEFNDLKLGFDIHTPDKFARKLSDMSEGRIPKANDEQLLQMRQTLESQRELFRQGLYTSYTNAGYHKALGDKRFNELIEEQLHPYDHVLSMIKDGKHENAYAGMNYYDVAVSSRIQELMSDKTAGPAIARAAAVEKVVPEMAKDVAKSYIMNGDLPKTIAGFNWDEKNKALEPLKPGQIPPQQIEAWRKLNLHAPNAPAAARMDLARIPTMLADPKLPDAQAKQVLDYAFNPGMRELLMSVERDSVEEGKYRSGRHSLWEDYTAQPMVDRAYKLGGKSWAQYKDTTEASFRGIAGEDVKNLANLDGRFKVSWNTDKGIKIERSGERVGALPLLKEDLENVGRFFTPSGYSNPNLYERSEKTLERNLNRSIEGLRRVYGKDGSDVNVAVLETLEAIAPELKDSPLHKQIMDAVIASGSQAKPQAEGKPKEE